MSDELQQRTREYYASDEIDQWLEYVYPRSGTAHFPFGHARALVLRAVLERHVGRAGTAYDIGCGAGQLSVILARHGLHVKAIDFSRPMLMRASRNAALAGVADRVQLIETDFLSPGAAARSSGDLAIAMGFLEYCTEPDRFFSLLRACLRPGATAVVEFRNRLLSASTANSFTLDELERGSLSELVREAEAAWTDRPPTAEDVEAYLAALRTVQPTTAEATVPPVTPFPVERRQHTFREIIGLAHQAGLEPLEFLGLHPHPFPPRVERFAPHAYNAAAWALQQLPRNPLVLASCSSAAAVLRAAA